MEQFKNDKIRIGWLDVYRGVLIILMVIGHSTGLYNKYIYQFHIAAFFFLSGYISHPEKKRFFCTLFEKVFTILLPAVGTVLFGFLLLWILHLGGFDALFSAWEFPGWTQALKAFFLHGINYVDVLGANWFLFTLFGVCVLNRLIYFLVRKYSIGSLIFSVVLYMAGYAIIKAGYTPHIGMFPLELIFIGNLFYTLGHCFQITNIIDQIVQSKIVWSFLMLGFSTICMYLIGYYLHITIDWPSRSFSRPILDGLAAMNGIFLFLAVSLLINHFLKRIGKLLCFIGKNTMGILLFHFTFFKIMYLPFYWMGIISRDDLSCITPGRMSTQVLAEKYWIFITSGSILLSLALWKLMLNRSVLRFLLGQSKQAYANIWSILMNTKFAVRLRHIKNLYLNRIEKTWGSISKSYRQNRLLYLSIILMLLLAAIPLCKQGIMCNDELQARLWSMKGFFDFVKHYVMAYLNQGRGLSVFINPVGMYIGFIGNPPWSFKIIQIMSILLCSGMFSVFLYMLFGNKNFAIVCGLSTFVYLPITFEHTCPNTFNTLVSIPFILLLASLILYLQYIKETTGHKKLVIAMVLLFLTLASYEPFITLIPLYYGIALGKIGFRDKRKIIKKCLPPTIIVLVFGVCYIISGILFRSSYSGNQIGFTFDGSLKIISQLVQSSFPGYYIFSNKYKYLFAIYNDLTLENYVRIFLVVSIFGSIIYYMICNEKHRHFVAIKFWSILGISALCILLPTLPNAIAKGYQGNVDANNNIALPATFLTYFAAIFLCCFLIWQLTCKVKKNGIILLVVIAASCYLVPIQSMNDVFAQQQQTNFQRLVTIESLFSTDLFAGFKGQVFCSTDFFNTQNALAIHDSYWNDFALTKDLNIDIRNRQGTVADKRIYLDDDKFFIWCGDKVCVASREPISGYGICKYAEDIYLVADYQDSITDNLFHEYYYALSDAGELRPSTQNAFEEEFVGNTLQDCRKIFGYYEDGWVGKSSLFQIKTGTTGRITIDIYCPLEDLNGKEVSIYIDQTLIDTVNLQEAFQSISINAIPNQVVQIMLETNFIIEDTGTDTRELSMIIQSMSGH